MAIDNEHVARLLEQRKDEIEATWKQVEEEYASAFVTHIKNVEALILATLAARTGILSEEQKRQVVERYTRKVN